MRIHATKIQNRKYLVIVFHTKAKPEELANADRNSRVSDGKMRFFFEENAYFQFAHEILPTFILRQVQFKL